MSGWRRWGAAISVLALTAGVSTAKSPRAFPTTKRTIPVSASDLAVLGWSSDGKQLHLSTADRELLRLEVRTGRIVSRWRLPEGRRLVGFRPDGRRIATLEQSGRLRIWNTGSRSVVRTLAGVTRCDHVTWSPNGTQLAVAHTGAGRPGEARGSGYRLRLNNHHRVDIYDLRTGSRLHTLRHLSADGPVEGHGFGGFTSAWSPDGRYLATGLLAGELARDSPLQVWDIATGKRVRRLGKLRSWMPLDSGSDTPAAPEWSPDGRRLGSTWWGPLGTARAEVRLWSPVSGSLERTMAAEEPVCEVAWSPGGEYLAGLNFHDYWGDTSDHTSRVWIWAPTTGRQLARFTEQRLFLSGLSWSPAGGALASAGSDGKVHVWSIPRLPWRSSDGSYQRNRQPERLPPQ